MKTKLFQLKPYLLVQVIQKDYVCIGEIISNPYPVDDNSQSGEAVKVRLVPNDPCSMVEVRTYDCRQLTYRPKWVSYAKVSGVGNFPVDMLRYEHAGPSNFSLTEDDWGRVEAKLVEGIGDSASLVIGKAHEMKNPNWTPARWASFGWSITPLRTLKLEGATANA